MTCTMYITVITVTSDIYFSLNIRADEDTHTQPLTIVAVATEDSPALLVARIFTAAPYKT